MPPAPCSAFVCNALLLHRWPVFVLMHVLLWLKDSVRDVLHVLGWEWVSVREQQAGHSVDARALVGAGVETGQHGYGGGRVRLGVGCDGNS